MSDLKSTKADDNVVSKESNVESIYREQEQLWFKRELRKKIVVKHKYSDEESEKGDNSKGDKLDRENKKNKKIDVNRKRKKQKDGNETANKSNLKTKSNLKMQTQSKKELKNRVKKSSKRTEDTSPPSKAVNDTSIISEPLEYNLQQIIDSLESPKKQTETSNTKMSDGSLLTKKKEDIECPLANNSPNNSEKCEEVGSQRNNSSTEPTGQSCVKRKKPRFRAPVKKAEEMVKQEKKKQPMDKNGKSQQSEVGKRDINEMDSDKWTSLTSEVREVMNGTRKFTDCQLSKEMDIWN